MVQGSERERRLCHKHFLCIRRRWYWTSARLKATTIWSRARLFHSHRANTHNDDGVEYQSGKFHGQNIPVNNKKKITEKQPAQWQNMQIGCRYRFVFARNRNIYIHHRWRKIKKKILLRSIGLCSTLYCPYDVYTIHTHEILMYFWLKRLKCRIHKQRNNQLTRNHCIDALTAELLWPNQSLKYVLGYWCFFVVDFCHYIPIFVIYDHFAWSLLNLFLFSRGFGLCLLRIISSSFFLMLLSFVTE